MKRKFFTALAVGGFALMAAGTAAFSFAPQSACAQTGGCICWEECFFDCISSGGQQCQAQCTRECGTGPC